MGSAPVDPALAAIWAEVLGVDELDVDDDFFALGGNSLLATQITARVADTLGVEVPLDALFEAPTLGEYAEQVRAAVPAETRSGSGGNGRAGGGGLRWLRGGRKRGGGSAAGVPEGALSALQGSAWAVQRYVPDRHAHVGQVFSLQGPVDAAALERALTELVRRHEILRTIFPLEDHRPRARVLPAGAVELELVALPRRAREAEVARHVDAAWSEPFDYASRPPLRARLIRNGPQAHVFVFILHEVVCDGQAYDLLVRELGALYRAAVRGGPVSLPDPPRQYQEIVRELGPQLAVGDAEASAAYWRETLAGAPLTLPLPFGADEAEEQAPSYTARSVQLPAQLGERLRALARQETATSFMLHLAALYTLLHRTTGETDVLVRSPAANRARVEWEQVVGFFSMTLPFRVDVGDDPSFRTLLRRTRDVSLGAFRHAALSPEDNAEHAIDGMRGLGGWSVLFRLWDPTTEQPLELEGVRAKPFREEGESGRLVLVVTERSDGRTVVRLSSSSPVFDARLVGELLRQYERVLTAVADDPDVRVGSGLALVTPAERDQLSGRAARAPSATGGLHELVAEHARATPDAVAFDGGGGDGALTYAQLDARAESLARALRARGIPRGAFVGLDIAPSGELLIAVLGALKAGAACVPLRDPGEDAPAGLPPLAATLTEADVRAADGTGDTASGEALDVEPDRVALLVRTTGVGGSPRRVELTLAAVGRAALLQRDAQRLAAGDRVAHVPGRGAWSWALAPWAALAAGATVVSPARAPDPRSATPPTGWLEANGVTVAAMGAGLAGAALARVAALPRALRLLLVQGPGALDVPAEIGGRGKLAVQRQYGLAEAGGAVLAERVSGSVADGAPVVGEPFGVRARVLDAHGNVAPAGVAGELELDDGDRTLRTGDLALRRGDGALEVFGRIADELRWRGVRLNPIMRDVETALAAHPGVLAAAVCWEAAHEALIACVVPRRAEAPDARELDGWLQQKMDDWILPAQYVTVEAIPVRPDGLADRPALAAFPAVRGALAEGAGRQPQTPTERKLAAIWSKVLDQRKPGADDNFFACGGNLIRGLELVGRANEAGIPIDAGDVLYRPTIAEMAANADEKR